MYPLINLIQVIQLYPRENVLKNTLLVLILVCVGFIGLSRLMSPQLFKIVNRDFWSRKFYNESFSDSDIISPAANFLLFLNLFISLNICLIAVLHESFNLEELVFSSFLMLSVFFLFQQLSFRLSSILLGESRLRKNMSVITQQIWNFLGLVIFLLALLILLNTQHAEIFRILVYIVLILLPFARIVKGVIYAKSNNYDWFYIILYLCTLEILPLVVLGKYFRELF